jgi:thioredoxin 1
MRSPWIHDLSQANFDQLVLLSKQPALVAFFSPWSPPCEMVESVFDAVADTCGGRANVFRVNVEENPDLTAFYDIRTIPTLLCFLEGHERVRIVGTTNKETVLAKVEPVLQQV